MKVLFACILTLCIALPAYAHPGKTDRYGGHKCLRECAEWDLFYSEYHTHDKDGKPVKMARKKPVRRKPEAGPVEAKAVVMERTADRPAEAPPSQPVAVAAATAVEPGAPSLPWILLLLLLLLLLVVGRRRKKGADAQQRS